MKKLSLFFISLLSLFISLNGVSAGVKDENSGISFVDYTIEWCPAHEQELGGCVGGETVRFPSNTIIPLKGIADVVSFLETLNTTGTNPFTIKGEGTLTINVVTQDKAMNTSLDRKTYLVDKSVPELYNFSFTNDNSPYLSYESSTKSHTMKLSHASNSTNSFSRPIYSNYADSPGVYTKNYSSIPFLRYNNSKGDLDFTISVNLSDSDEYPDGSGKYFSSHVSGESFNIDLIDENSSNIVSISSGRTFSTSSLNLAPNTGKYFGFRFYDRVGNYIEIPFFAFNDQLELQSTSGGTNVITIENGGFGDIRVDGDVISKFIKANDSFNVNYSRGSGDQYTNLLNGSVEGNVNDHMADGIIMQVGTGTSVGVAGGGTYGAYDLSEVDSSIYFNGAGKYSEYPVTFSTPGMPVCDENPSGNCICDAAGNCISGEDVLTKIRVMADDIDHVTSQISVGTTSGSGSKIFADNSDSYDINYRIRDQYGNSVSQVVDQTNNVDIKSVVSTFSFDNGLSDDQIANIDVSEGVNDNVLSVDLSSVENGVDNINDLDQIELQEDHNSLSDGVFDFSISSKLPTKGGYKYMGTNASLTISDIANLTTFDDTGYVLNDADVADNIATVFPGTSYITINNEITEEKTDRLNVDINEFNDYAELITNGLSTAINLTGLNKNINFEFGSPIVYHATNFNILRDGVYSDHNKNFINLAGVSAISLFEQYFDIDGNSVANNNSKANFYATGATNFSLELNDPYYNDLQEVYNINFIGSTSSGSNKVMYEAKAGQNFDNWGYVSYIKYTNGEDYYIPSISRGIDGDDAATLFPTITPNGDGLSNLTQDIAVTGILDDNLTGARSDVDSQDGLVVISGAEPINRTDVLATFKKNLFRYNSGGNWCGSRTTTIDALFSQNCVRTIGTEQIAYVEGNLTLECAGGNNTCSTSGNRSIVVKDGRVTINSNINTNGSDARLLIGSITNAGLSNIDILNDFDDISKQQGWIAISEDITNIDAYMISQGPTVSSRTNGDVIIDFDNPRRLLNQLHIYGSLFSLNTIGGSKKVGYECPYIEEDSTCNLNSSKVYDLSLLRRYVRVDAGNFGGSSGALVPYWPSFDFVNDVDFGTSRTKSSGFTRYYGDGTQDDINGTNLGNTDLREARVDHLDAPIIIEKDNSWLVNPSVLMEVD